MVCHRLPPYFYYFSLWFKKERKLIDQWTLKEAEMWSFRCGACFGTLQINQGIGVCVRVLAQQISELAHNKCGLKLVLIKWMFG